MTATQSPPVASSTLPVLDDDEVMRHGVTFQVYLIGYDPDGLWRAWNELQRHARFVELSEATEAGSALGGALAGGALLGPIGALLGAGAILAGGDPIERTYHRTPRLLGRNEVGAVYDASALVQTWRRPGSEYTWGGLLAALNRRYQKDGDEGTLGGYCAPVVLGAETQAVQRAGEVVDDVAAGGAGIVQGAGEVARATGGAARAVGNAATGLGQLGNALGATDPLIALAALATLVVGGMWVKKELS